LGYIFGAPVASSAPSKPIPSSNVTAGGELDLLGEFDAFGSNPAPVVNKDLPPMENVLRADMTQGIIVDTGYKRENNQVVMVVKVTNNGQQGITALDIKFNNNYLGIQPTQTLPLNGSVNAGFSQVAEVTLALPGDPQQRTPFVPKVQAAVRVSLSSGQKVVHKFETTISPHFFLETATIEKNDYLEKWKNIPQTDGQSIQLKSLKSIDVEDIKTSLAKSNCQFIAQREIPDKGVSLYFSAKLRGELMLVEIAVATTGMARIQVRSDNKYSAMVTANALQFLLS